MAENENSRPRELVRASEQAQIERTVVAWLNTYAEKPARRVDFEYLGKTGGLTVSTIQSAYKLKKYITGGYMAQYQFQIVYRLIAVDVNARLAADEALNSMAEWAENNPPVLPAGISLRAVRRDTGAFAIARYENNAEDHSIQMTLTYEVI